MNEKQIKIGSRESRLAVRQSEIIIDEIKKADPGVEIALVTMKTTGDMILDQSLELIGGKGLFVKELDHALLEKRCDLTVHSLKDMPMELSWNLPLLAYSKREDPRDVLVLRKGLEKLPVRPVIGTGSRRRTLQAGFLYPAAQFKGIRGNVQTRLAKLDNGEYDALIMAAAGLIRGELTERISRYFSPEEIIPAAGQGIMAIQGRAGEEFSFLPKVNSAESAMMALAERSFVRTLDGGCSSPIAAYARVGEEVITLLGLHYHEETGAYTTGSRTGSIHAPELLGKELALELKQKLESEYRGKQ